MFEHEKTRGKTKGKKGYGWPSSKNRWCTYILKKQVIERYLRNYTKQGYEVIEYHGIAFDEQHRLLNNKEKNIRYPLNEWKITEAEALEYCYSNGYSFSGLYNVLDRVSCWCCPLSNLKELKNLYKYFPQKWEELKALDNKSYNTMRFDYSLNDLEQRFSAELEIEAILKKYQDCSEKVKKGILRTAKKIIMQGGE